MRSSTIFSKQTLKLALVLLSLAVGVAQGAYLLHQFERYRQASGNAIAFENERGEIARLDEVLTMSARLHAATGEKAWRARYLHHVEPLERALDEALALAADEAALHAIDQVAESNALLIALEEKSLRLAAEDRLSEALAMLTSASYEQYKTAYQEGLTQALEISRSVLQSKVDGLRSGLLVAIFVSISSLLALSELWRRLSLSEQRQAAKQIEDSLQREQHLSSMQRQFVSILSHELRTPIAIIDGKAQRMLRAKNPTQDKIRACGETIRDAVKHLTGLMEGVLNVSRIEEGRIDIKPETFDLSAMIEKVVADHREVDGAGRIELSVAGLPGDMRGDPRLLIQVVSNLVSNALKYSDSSSPVRIEGYQDHEEVVIAVHDQGVGIPKDEIENIGQRFFRASSSAGIAGTGIGLHFIKHLIDLHEGRMEVNSTEGVGSSFVVRLPHRLVVQPAPESIPSGTAGRDVPAALPAHY